MKRVQEENEYSPVLVCLVPNETHGGGAPSPINVRTCFPINYNGKSFSGFFVDSSSEIRDFI